MRFFRLWPALFLALPCFATLTVTMTPSVASPQLIGTPVTFTATATDTSAGTINYQFSVAKSGQPYQVSVDFSYVNTYVFAPSLHEGSYSVQVVAENLSTKATATAQVTYNIGSRVTGSTPAITAVQNPLVALYSAPSCPSGSSMYIVFQTSTGVGNHTDGRPCAPPSSMNFYIGGMLPSTTYNMHYVVQTGSSKQSGPTGTFKTGALPAGIPFPAITVPTPATSKTATAQSVLLIDNLTNSTTSLFVPTATDLSGNTLWYYPKLATSVQAGDFYIRPVTGGTFMLNIADPSLPVNNQKGQFWREIDLAGNTIRETNVTRVSAQLNSYGALGVTDFDHDAIRLPNGHTLILCSQEEIFPAGTQGATAPLDIVGNLIVDLDANLQVAWWWSAYDHMDVNRPAVLGETCAPGQPGCPPLNLASTAADWLHGNSLNYIPASGDILLSVRNQDWLVKIDYNNGAGTGAVLWEMGVDGNFTFTGSSDPYPWFSHQHDAEYELGGTTVLSLFDNGNTRVSQNPGENSRGMVLNVNEPALTVSSFLTQDLGIYSMAVGSAQRLDNGDYHFLAGFVNPSLNFEYSPAGVLTYELSNGSQAYRSYRMDSLYILDGPSN